MPASSRAGAVKLRKICSACAAEGLLELEYTVHPGNIMIKFTAPEDRIVRVTDTGDEASGYKLGTPAMK
jgi:hypothetical protein